MSNESVKIIGVGNTKPVNHIFSHSFIIVNDKY